FGEATAVGNKPWLVKRIAWRLQALAEGDLSERARRRAAELANDADLRLNPPRDKTATAPQEPAGTPASPDPRLPPPASLLPRPYKGRQLQVQVLDDGFAFEGLVYRSLTAWAYSVGPVGAFRSTSTFHRTPSTSRWVRSPRPWGARAGSWPAGRRSSASSSTT